MTMLLKFGPQTYGVHPQLLRAATRNLLMIHSAELYDLCVVLGVSPEVGEPIWKALIADGYIEQDAVRRWRPAERMRLLASARIGNPLSRLKAEQLLHQAVQNAIAINAFPPEAPYFYITALAVFGAFLDADKGEIETLDLAWESQARPGIAHRIQPHLSALRDPFKSTRGKLRPRSGFVRLTSMQNLIAQDRTFRLIYQFESPALPVQERAEQRMLHRTDRAQEPMPPARGLAQEGDSGAVSQDP